MVAHLHVKPFKLVQMVVHHLASVQLHSLELHQIVKHCHTYQLDPHQSLNVQSNYADHFLYDGNFTNEIAFTVEECGQIVSE